MRFVAADSSGPPRSDRLAFLTDARAKIMPGHLPVQCIILLIFLCNLEISKDMDLKRLRTFVAVAELGTVSRAALGLRISQSALSRQISDLEQEFGFKLFDRVGRRLILTAIGEQLLGDCRDVLGHVGSLGERVDLLRRGDSGVLKVAAPPHTIESVLSTFLPRYARTLSQRAGETDRGPWSRYSRPCWNAARYTSASDTIKMSIATSRATPLPPDEVLAACEPSLELGHAGMIDIGRLASYPLLLLESGYSLRRLFNAACRLARRRAQHSAREPRAAHLAGARRGRAGGSDHSVAPANGSLRAENRPRNTSAQTASGAIGHSVGQAAPNPALCRKLLRGARRVHARGSPDHAAVGKQDGGHTEASCCPKPSQAHRPRLKGLLSVSRRFRDVRGLGRVLINRDSSAIAD